MSTGIRLYLGQVDTAERRLAEAFDMMASRHSSDPDIRDTAALLARWTRARVLALAPALERHGVTRSGDGDRLRAALFHGVRVGGVGALRDLHDLGALVEYVRLGWTALSQAAMELRDSALQATCASAAKDVDRQLAWVKTRMKLMAPQSLTVPPARADQLRASLPERPSAAALPDAVWAPLAGGGLALAVGLASLAAGQAWLLPSLGPTAYLQAEMPAHPAARAYNTMAGHLIGLASGFVALWITAAWAAPVVLATGVLTGRRLTAAVIALVLTIAVTLAAKAAHPPAAATTLLVALGSLQTAPAALSLAMGAALIALLGEGVRHVRLGGRPIYGRRSDAIVSGAAAPTQTAGADLRKAA